MDSAKPLPSVERSMMAAANASAAITRIEMTPTPRLDTTVSVSSERSRSFNGAPRCSQIIRIPPRMTARTANVSVQGINSLLTAETTGLGVPPSSLARFTVGMETQKVDRVVTIWLMPSMMAFARLLMRRQRSQRPIAVQDTQSPNFALLAISDPSSRG
jgi:hypothetical protein